MTSWQLMIQITGTLTQNLSISVKKFRRMWAHSNKIFASLSRASIRLSIQDTSKRPNSRYVLQVEWGIRQKSIQMRPRSLSLLCWSKTNHRPLKVSQSRLRSQTWASSKTKRGQRNTRLGPNLRSRSDPCHQRNSIPNTAAQLSTVG